MPDDSTFATNIERFTGFAGHYDAYRASPPEILAELLIDIAGPEQDDAVVDLGCGTGLSTRYWARRVEKIIGIEPTDAMRAEAEKRGGEGVSYQRGFSHATGLPDDSAFIVTCAQALHWMEPDGTFAEAKRILRPGGVFAACDYDWPPVTGVWELEAAYLECDARAREIEKGQGLSSGLIFHEKAGHLGRMKASGVFRWVREILLHHEDQGDAARLIGLVLSQGSVQTLLKAGYTEADIGLDRLREIAFRLIPHPQRWIWCSRIRLGVV